MRDSYFSTNAQVTCTDNGKTMEADVVDFRQGVYLVVSVSTVRVNLQYDAKHQHYVGNMSGLEFVSFGPEKEY